MHSVTTISHTAETDTGSLSRLHSHPQTFYTGGGIFAILTPPHPFKKKKKAKLVIELKIFSFVQL